MGTAGGAKQLACPGLARQRSPPWSSTAHTLILTGSETHTQTHTHTRNGENNSEILINHTEWALRRIMAGNLNLLTGCTWEGFLEEAEMEERMKEQQLGLQVKECQALGGTEDLGGHGAESLGVRDSSEPLGGFLKTQTHVHEQKCRNF